MHPLTLFSTRNPDLEKQKGRSRGLHRMVRLHVGMLGKTGGQNPPVRQDVT